MQSTSKSMFRTSYEHPNGRPCLACDMIFGQWCLCTGLPRMGELLHHMYSLSCGWIGIKQVGTKGPFARQGNLYCPQLQRVSVLFVWALVLISTPQP